MKHFMIKYRFANGSKDAWHARVAEFMAALDSDPELQGRISYLCMKERDGENYYHLADAADAEAIATLQSREFFKSYTEATREVAGGDVTVMPMERIGRTAFQGP